MSLAEESPTIPHLAFVFAEAKRSASKQLYDHVIPALPPARRVFALDVVKRLARQHPPTEQFVRDLEALAAMLEREEATHSIHGWEADADHVRGGWPTIHRDEDGMALACGAVAIRDLMRAAERLIDATGAERMARLVEIDAS